MPSNWRNKTRRPHTKSRKGCVRCKRQRRKCDERSPSCTRCASLNIECQYLAARIDTESPVLHGSSIPDDIDASLVERIDSMLSPSTSTTLNDEVLSISPLHFEAHTSDPKPWSPSESRATHRNGALQEANLPPLDAQDLELLTHYLSHTSQTIPFDKIDLYALQIGIPNLAFGSKPLMSSVLALAAVCQCHDLLPTPDDLSNLPLPLPRIQSLLELAERHHRNSLHQIQKAIGTERYDTVLANATLMTLYGSAVHCVRIRLINLHQEGRLGAPLPSEFVPAQSQWISLIRAVHCAFIGLRADVELEGPQNSASPSSVEGSDGELGFDDEVGEVKCSQDGPTKTTLHLFLPIVTATIGAALETLRTRIWRSRESNSSAESDFEACTGALEILESIVVESLSGIKKGSATVTPEDSHDGFIGRLSLVTPWLRAYTARVTSNSDLESISGSATPSPLRRKITAFLNRVDAGFLSLVQDKLELMTLPSPGERGRCFEDENDASRCAMDIFAHWLVLMCLLDGVWWIGGIGMWELGRVVNYMKRPHGREVGQNIDAWWPASMYAIRTELANQRV
ncbi:hypothetical protein N0V93_003663 [Gnomoniopsis smithogilvyi]|uniref:Zn(2)-C6 fungal-type domain-containing protein n=1 Tax=Gnomoniopsis smithogilvyi TaxID=1191159 RepID=A0A9W8Z172_9PEZI|nr:hypothetical protein N0V93_003663 [Gnomoniopsis smithogilvyi]